MSGARTSDLPTSAGMCYQSATMTLRSLTLLAVALAASPALAIQEVPLGPRAPSFAAGSAPQMGFDPLALPGITAPSSMSFTPGPELRRDPATWAFSGGETTRIGSMVFNMQSGPSWSMNNGTLGRGDFGFSRFETLGRSPLDFGFTSRATTGFLASETLMFYTSVGSTTWRPVGSAAPLAPGLQLLEAPSQRMDMRAGFKAELMPGVTFGLEAGFAPPAR